MRTRQYPEQTGPYLVKVKSEKSTDSWQMFDVARLQISVGQDYHEGEKLRATLGWLKARFSIVKVCVNDTLQRFNLMFEEGLDSAEAYNTSRQNGLTWAEKYTADIGNNKSADMVHWDFWLNHADYPLTRKKIDELYLWNIEFRDLINQNISEIWSRRCIKKPDIYSKSRFQEFFDLSRQYLLEEISVFSMMFENEKAIDVYPGTTIFAATVLQGRRLQGAPDGLGRGHFCRIDFSRNPSFAANVNTRPFKDKGMTL